MFKTTLASSLGSLQFFFILAKFGLDFCGLEISWVWVLLPLWTLVGIAVLFWLLAGALAKAVS